MTVTRYLLLDRMKVQAANGLSSPLTYGFPALSGFVGFSHALCRRLRESLAVNVDGVLVANHHYRVHRYRPHRYADYTFIQSRNPILRSGKTAAIVEQAKVDLTVSLVLRMTVDDDRMLEECDPAFEEVVTRAVLQMRLCGGSVHGVEEIRVLSDLADVSLAVLPGFVLNDGSDRLVEIQAKLRRTNPNATGLDALVEQCTLYQVPEADETADQDPNDGPTGELSSIGALEEGTDHPLESSGEPINEPVKWRTKGEAQRGGWYVPIPMGYQSISAHLDKGALVNSRSNQYRSVFVESVYGLGKWEFPTRIAEIGNCFWRYDYERQKEGLFLLTQDQPVRD
jgi:CRISPR-associated protein Csy2